MLGIGSSLSSRDVITLMPFIGHPIFQLIFTWMSKVGSFAFSFLPVMFAIAIPLGMRARKQGRRRLLRLRRLRRAESGHQFLPDRRRRAAHRRSAGAESQQYPEHSRIQSIDTGILGAVIVGIIVYRLHERFHTIRLPDALAFFGGTRFVPTSPPWCWACAAW